MNFFVRKNAHFVVEEKTTPELTKQILCNKILFLQGQYKSAYDSIKLSEFLSPDFSFDLLCFLDFRKKILESLFRLASSSDCEWLLLKSFKSDDDRFNVFGEFKNPAFCLETGKIQDNSDYFFLRLLNIGIIDSQYWLQLSRIKNLLLSSGVEKVNDSSYYDFKNESIVDTPVLFSVYDDQINSFKESVYSFVGRSISFRSFVPIFWNFLKNSTSKSGKLFSLLLSNHYSYDEIRKNISGKSISQIPKNQIDYLISALDKLNSFDSLYKSMEEFAIIQNSEMIKMFKHVFLFFLSQQGHIFDLNNPKYVARSLFEKCVSSLQWLNLFYFLCEHEIPVCFSSVGNVCKTLSMACEIEIGILRDEKILPIMFAFNLANMTMIVELARKLKNNNFYKKYYFSYLDRYLEKLSIY